MGSTIVFLSFLLLTAVVIDSVNSYPRNLRESRTLSSSPSAGRTLSGVPDKDFPILEFVPVTGFKCVKHMPGYFADMEARCQVFHICQEDGRHDAFLCPNGTLFNQKYFVCDWWYNVDCRASDSYYYLNRIFRQDSSVNAAEPEDYAKLGSHASTSTISKTEVGTKDEKTMNKKIGSPVAISLSLNSDSAKNADQQTVSTNATREQSSPSKAASSSSVSKVTILTSTSGTKKASSNKKNKTKVNATKYPSASYSANQAQGGSSVVGTDEYMDSTENPTTILPPSDETEENLGTTELNISEQLAMIPLLTGSVASIIPETSNYDTSLLDAITTELPLKQESTAAPLSAEIGTFNSNSTSSISADTVLPYVESAYPSDQEYLSAVMTTVQPESAEVQANVVTEPSTSSEGVVTPTTAQPGSSSTEKVDSSSVDPLIQLESLRPEVATEYFPLATEEELGSGSSATTALPLDDSTTVTPKTEVLAPTPLPAAMTLEPHKEAAATQVTSTGTVTMMPGSYYANKFPSSVSLLYSQVVTETVPKNNHSNTIAIASSSSPTTTVTSLIDSATIQNGSTKQPSTSNRPTAEQNNKSPVQYNDKTKPSNSPKVFASSSYGNKTKTVSAKAITNN